ncbi:D-aminoacyl-tRNA deacylase [Papillibacter cinnamivorans]|uniref:D-aminoacyl-tRNA deacylase n=1 Tax=Papillibacter cinnamivorans DSM 12816 TaxID=1122930 RepID=A0A1W2A1P9_9FIRM|nr:D-aminoacyl-tRNA deacylase [Papillibacter cinnamivorans]SMC54584.1 D-tyrosyl-tRNA(Tyr) deacylase [Papillibacter cinnamivorans DSM 12816]
MRAVVTRVTSASVTSGEELLGEIGPGFLILLGIGTGDTEETVNKLTDKIAFLRVFEDEGGKMNLSLKDSGGAMLVISQFTLYANCRRGRRPDFLEAARPELAVPLYEAFTERCRSHGFRVETGRFGANMKVSSVNDGPVTLLLDTDLL